MFRRLLEKLRETDLYFSLFSKNKARFHVEGHCLMTGNCCRNLILVDLAKPVRSRKQFEKLCAEEPYHRMFVPHKNVSSDGFLRFSCNNLGEDNKCSIHESRPEMCRRYPDSRILKLGGELLPGCGYRIIPEKSFSGFLDDEL